LRKEEGWAGGQQPPPVKPITATETTSIEIETENARRRRKGSSTDELMKGAGESHPETCHLRHLIFNAKTDTRIGTWNVRTLYQTGKLGQVLKEMRRYKLEILGIGELRWTGQGRIKSENVTILFSGHETQHVHGVGLLLDQITTDLSVKMSKSLDFVDFGLKITATQTGTGNNF
jgi:hypothetical protein